MDKDAICALMPEKFRAVVERNWFTDMAFIMQDGMPSRLRPYRNGVSTTPSEDDLARRFFDWCDEYTRSYDASRIEYARMIVRRTLEAMP